MLATLDPFPCAKKQKKTQKATGAKAWEVEARLAEGGGPMGCSAALLLAPPSTHPHVYRVRAIRNNRWTSSTSILVPCTLTPREDIGSKGAGDGSGEKKSTWISEPMTATSIML
jgi:hypothetical protein